MYRNILITLGFLLFSACTQTKPTQPTKPKEEVKIPIKTVVKEPIKVEVKAEVLKDFIPEHLKNAKIEVVKHY